MIFFLNARHRASIIPLFIIYEAYAFHWIYNQVKQRKFKELSASLIFITVFLFAFKPQSLDDKNIAFTRHAKSGPIYEHKGDYANAQKEYFSALAINPFDSNTLYNLGTAYLLEGNLTKAKEFLQKSLDTCGHNVDTLFNLSYIYEQEGDLDKASETLSKVLKYQKESPDVYFRLGTLNKKMNNCSEAINFFQKTLELAPKSKNQIYPLILECQKPQK